MDLGGQSEDVLDGEEALDELGPLHGLELRREGDVVHVDPSLDLGGRHFLRLREGPQPSSRHDLPFLGLVGRLAGDGIAFVLA